VRIPADAVIHSGTKSVVFVALGSGKFQPREVQVGEGSSDFVEVVSGIDKGEGVVTRANFLVDSESRLRASLAALSSEGSGAPARAGHDGHGGDATRADAPAKTPAADPHAGHRR
jgi:Cu(I)/Ag(I) efflux system membrane fusion protein